MRKHRLLLAIAGSTLLFACNDPKNQRGSSSVAFAVAPPQKDSVIMTSAALPNPLPAAAQQPPSEGQRLAVSQRGAARTVTVSASEPVFLQGAQGTTVAIAANSLVLEGSGEPPKGPVTISVQEYTSTADILQAKLSTTSGGRLLETGGMIYISATADGARCALRPGSSADVTFASRRSGDGMQLFTGRMVNGSIDWELSEQQQYGDDGYGECGVLRYVTTDPYFPNGSGALKQFLTRHLDWPDDREGPITSVDVVISYEVNERGVAGKPSIMSTLSPGYDSAFALALQEMPRWRPATCNGSAVSARIFHRLSYWWPENASASNARMRCSISPPATDSIYPKVEPRRYTVKTFRTPSLGWINCDRFIEDTREKTEFIVNASGEPDVKLVFHNIRSVMQGAPAAGRAVFPGVPKGEPVTVVAFRKEGTQLFMAMADANTGAGAVKELDFQKVDKDAVRERLLQLDERIRKATALKPAGTEPGYVFQQSKTTR